MNRKKILVVDDDAVIRKQLSLKLNRAGYNVLNASEGSEAVGVARKEKPDLIIVDIGFPPDVAHGGGVPWDGFLIIDWLRRMDELKQIPIIVITGSDLDKFKDRAKTTGAVAFFQKPIADDMFLSVIQKTIGEGSPEPGA